MPVLYYALTLTVFFFDGTSHFITSAIAIFLVVSELGFFKAYFARHWPLLSEESGLVFLGLAMITIGFNTLGNLNKVATSVQNLGLPLWRVVISGGILCALMGLFNIIAVSLSDDTSTAELTTLQGFIFCDRKNHITSRQIRSDGAVAPIDNLNKSSGSFTSKGSSRRPASLVLPSYHETTDNRRRSKFGFILPKRLSKLEISRPVATDPEQFKQWESTSQPVGESRKSPIAPELSRPPTAMHPAYSPSRYSVFSGGSRF
jgi:hypothetical protein